MPIHNIYGRELKSCIQAHTHFSSTYIWNVKHYRRGNSWFEMLNTNVHEERGVRYSIVTARITNVSICVNQSSSRLVASAFEICVAFRGDNYESTQYVVRWFPDACQCIVLHQCNCNLNAFIPKSRMTQTTRMLRKSA